MPLDLVSTMYRSSTLRREIRDFVRRSQLARELRSIALSAADIERRLRGMRVHVDDDDVSDAVENARLTYLTARDALDEVWSRGKSRRHG